MKVKVKNYLGDSNPSGLLLDASKEYEVYSVLSSLDATWFTLVNDAKAPVHYDAKNFVVTDFSIPKDWHINSTSYYPVMLGPSFVIKTQESADNFLNSSSEQYENLKWYLENVKQIEII